jgi:hypothetical protein
MESGKTEGFLPVRKITEEKTKDKSHPENLPVPDRYLIIVE